MDPVALSKETYASLPKEAYGVICDYLSVYEKVYVMPWVCQQWYQLSDRNLFFQMQRNNELKLNQLAWFFHDCTSASMLVHPRLQFERVACTFDCKLHWNSKTLKVYRTKSRNTLESTYRLSIEIFYFFQRRGEHILSRKPLNLRCNVSISDTSLLKRNYSLKKAKDSQNTKKVLTNLLGFEMDLILKIAEENVKYLLERRCCILPRIEYSYPCDDYGKFVGYSNHSFSLKIRRLEKNLRSFYIVDWKIADFDRSAPLLPLIKKIEFHQLIRWCVISETAERLAKRLGFFSLPKPPANYTKCLFG